MLSTIKNLFRSARGSNAKIVQSPWDFPELMLMEWLRSRKNGVSVFVIGAYLGYEVNRLFSTKAVEKIVLFEALPSTATRLRARVERFGERVEVVEAAACDFDGKTSFFETNLPGAGSILEVSAFTQDNFGAQQAYEVEVEALRIDSFAARRGIVPDVLWIDVQGAETKVLRGAEQCLANVQIVFIEVSTWAPLYEGACLIDEITEILAGHGFRQIQLGTDMRTGTGNALYAKGEALFEKAV